MADISERTEDFILEQFVHVEATISDNNDMIAAHLPIFDNV